MSAAPDSETKEKAPPAAPKLTYGINGRVEPEVVGKHGDFYLRRGEELRRDRDEQNETQRAVQSGVQRAVKIGKEAAAAAKPARTNAIQIPEKTVEVISTEMKAGSANGTYKTDSPVAAIIATQPNPMEFKFDKVRTSATANAASESIEMPPSAIMAYRVMVQSLVKNQQTGTAEPVFVSTIDLDSEKQNETARRRPRGPTPQGKMLAEWKSRSLIEKVTAARRLAAEAARSKK